MIPPRNNTNRKLLLIILCSILTVALTLNDGYRHRAYADNAPTSQTLVPVAPTDGSKPAETTKAPDALPVAAKPPVKAKIHDVTKIAPQSKAVATTKSPAGGKMLDVRKTSVVGKAPAVTKIPAVTTVFGSVKTPAAVKAPSDSGKIPAVTKTFTTVKNPAVTKAFDTAKTSASGKLSDLTKTVAETKLHANETMPISKKYWQHDDADKYWLRAKQEVDKSVMELLAQHQDDIDYADKLHIYPHGDLEKKEIALTFDDGPHPQFTPRLLAILKEYDVKATFFLVGEKAEEAPYLVKAEAAEGHCIGNHTYHHVNLTKIPSEYVATEIKACGEVLEKITGQAPHLFRPPGGDFNAEVALVPSTLGYAMVLWTDDPGDYASPGSQVILERTLKHATNGGIILLHDGIPQTMDILPQLITTLRAEGYQFVTIDEMMGNN